MGSGRHKSASARRNAAVHAPIARPSERIAATVVTLLCARRRQPYTASARGESSHITTRASCVLSRCFSGEPSARLASSASSPSACASSKCAASSSSISRFTRSGRNAFSTRDHSDISPLHFTVAQTIVSVRLTSSQRTRTQRHDSPRRGSARRPTWQSTRATRLRLPQHAIHSLGHRLPLRLLGGELLFALRGQLVDARATPRILRHPRRAHPARLFHAVQRWIERAFLHAQHVARPLANRRHDRVAVQPPMPPQRLHHQQVQRALHPVRLSHTQPSLY